MSSVNKVILLGRLGKDPESKSLENGTVVTTFSVATSESWKDKTTGEKKETTTWHNVVAWRSVGEIAAKYLKKGSQVYLEGKLTSRSYEDKTGVTKYVTEINVSDLTLLGNPGQAQGNKPEPAGVISNGTDSSDDLPF